LALSVLALVSCGTEHYARPGTEPPVAAGMARLYFFRDQAPNDPQDWTTVSLNGRKVGDSAPGTVFYRDVPPGRYEVSVRSDLLYPDQFKTVTVASGDVVYAKIASLPHWGATGWGSIATTFVVVIVNPALAQRALAGLYLTPG
jgi:hypothetical protein